MKPLHEQCAELAGDFEHKDLMFCMKEYPEGKRQEAGYAVRDAAHAMSKFLRHLSTVLRHEGMTDEKIGKKLDKYGGNWRDFARDIEQETAAPLLARIAELEARLNETHTDENGTVWTVPTAWAYFAACRALEEHKSKEVAELYHEGYAKGRGDGYEHGYKVGRRDGLEEAAKVCWISVDKYSCEHAIRALIGKEK